MVGAHQDGTEEEHGTTGGLERRATQGATHANTQNPPSQVSPITSNSTVFRYKTSQRQLPLEFRVLLHRDGEGQTHAPADARAGERPKPSYAIPDEKNM